MSTRTIKICVAVFATVLAGQIATAAALSPSTESAIQSVFFGRAIERVLIVFTCFASICFGFLLFRIIVKDSSSVAASGGGYKFSATRIGPGVFFCAFGTLGLIQIINSEPRLDIPVSKETAPDAQRSQAVILSGGLAGIPSDRDIKRTRVMALNSAMQVMSESMRAEKSPKNVSQAIAVAKAWRDELVAEIVGRERFERYLAISERLKTRGAGDLGSEDLAIKDEVDQLRSQLLTVE